MDGLTYQFHTSSNFAMRQRFFAMLKEGKKLPAYREIQLSVELSEDALHDRLSNLDGFLMTRFDEKESLLESDQDLIHVHISKRKRYSSLHFRLWTSSVARATALIEQLKATVSDALIENVFFRIDWHFASANEGIGNVLIDEVADESLRDSAYPSVAGGVHAFINNYLNSDQPILVIHGPPGTGKTRLVRAILGELSRREGGDCRIMFTGDDALLNSDELFMRFIGSGHQAFVIEDADHLLKPRKDGNKNLHRFLTISDGIVKAQGRKIIFTSNLPNLGDIDEALLRPGRCFSCLTLPRLGWDHVEKLLRSMHQADEDLSKHQTRLFNEGTKSVSLADIYGTFNQLAV